MQCVVCLARVVVSAHATATFIRKRRLSTQETSWLMSVAMAAPATPIFSPAMNTRSRMMLVMEAQARLLPTTKGQKMLMLIGKGGEGKSRIGLVMRSLLGDSMNTTSIQKVESNRFSRADLENKLLMVDDDMDMSALPKTNYIKSIVTSECKMDMERCV